jgi:hypothetical protein
VLISISDSITYYSWKSCGKNSEKSESNEKKDKRLQNVLTADSVQKACHSGNRIIATPAPRMTAQNPPDGEPGAFYSPVLPDGFQPEMGAGRGEPASYGQPRRKSNLIKPDQSDEYLLTHKTLWKFY